MRTIGLTGPIAAGKDTVARILQRHGAYIINADRVAHELYASQTPVWHALVRAFGSKILNRGGKINRKKLGAIVFGDKKKLAHLNQIVHPALREEIIKRVESRQSSVVSCQLIVINAAVLKEIGLLDYVDEAWVVMASRAIRLKRLIKKGLSKAEAQRKIKAQATRQEYFVMADFVIKNDGTLKQLQNRMPKI